MNIQLTYSSNEATILKQNMKPTCERCPLKQLKVMLNLRG